MVRANLLTSASRILNALRLAFVGLILTKSQATAEPILTSWFTNNSAILARVIETSGAAANTTWPSAGVANNNTGGAAQTLPAYSDVQRIRYTATDVYINANGLASYPMGPWYVNSGALFGFWPLARDYQVRITRTPTAAVSKTKHPGGMIGMMVNGVAIYDLGDAFSFKQTANTPTVTGTDQMGAGGDGYWSRDALAVEVVTFDPGFAHQPGNNGQYHYHAEPKALRYQLGDNMRATYDAVRKLYTYSETDPSGTSVPLHHSPLLGWAYDGYPIYGPYGYSNNLNSASPVVRMRTGFVLRNGQNGTQDLRLTGRVTLPKWAAIAQGYTTAASTNPFPLTAAQYGPSTSYTTSGPGGITTYSLGRYTGDYENLGDLGQTQGTTFDLDQYNGRTCVTPEFPGGTYAYFVAIDANGNTAFPHMLGKEYYGTPNGGNATTVPGNATDLFHGGPSLQETLARPAVDAGSGNVTLVWSSVEGGSYRIERSIDLTNWTPIVSNVPAAANALQTTATNIGGTLDTNRGFYRVVRDRLAPYDP